MGDWVFQGILSMLVGSLMYLYFLKVFVIPHGVSVFDIPTVTYEKLPYEELYPASP